MQSKQLNYPIRMSWMPVEEISQKKIAATFERVMQSHNEFVLDDDVAVNAVTLEDRRGGCRVRRKVGRRTLAMEENLRKDKNLLVPPTDVSDQMFGQMSHVWHAPSDGWFGWLDHRSHSPLRYVWRQPKETLWHRRIEEVCTTSSAKEIPNQCIKGKDVALFHEESHLMIKTSIKSKSSVKVVVQHGR